MQLRPYQTQAVDSLERFPRGICQIPCGGGKTIVAAELVRRHSAQYPQFRVLWLAATREQVGQGKQALELLGVPSGAANAKIGCPAGNLDDAWWRVPDATLLIVDECQHAAAEGWRRVIERTHCHRYGFSATPERADDLAPVVHQLLGEVVAKVDHAALHRSGNLSRGQVVSIRYEPAKGLLGAVAAAADGDTVESLWGDDVPDWRKRRYWRALLNVGVIANPQRNALIVRAARYHVAIGHSVLIVVPTVEHGRTLTAAIGLESELVHSKLANKRRAALIEEFRQGTLPCLVATSLADEGLDVPRASVLILATANRSTRTAEQRAGRVLRAMANKPEAIIYDFEDHWHPWLAGQGKSRRATYAAMGLTLKEVSDR